MTDKEKVMAARDKAQSSFDHTARKSMERIAEARIREERLEELADFFIKAVSQAWEKLKAALEGLGRWIWTKLKPTLKPLIEWIKSQYSQRPKREIEPDRIHQQRIKQEHHDEARLTVSIYELQQYKQIQRHSGQRRK